MFIGEMIMNIICSIRVELLVKVVKQANRLHTTQHTLLLSTDV
jgi:hypothetical protein